MPHSLQLLLPAQRPETFLPAPRLAKPYAPVAPNLPSQPTSHPPLTIRQQQPRRPRTQLLPVQMVALKPPPLNLSLQRTSPAERLPGRALVLSWWHEKRSGYPPVPVVPYGRSTQARRPELLAGRRQMLGRIAAGPRQLLTCRALLRRISLGTPRDLASTQVKRSHGGYLDPPCSLVAVLCCCRQLRVLRESLRDGMER